jgi:hypothetical protein
MVRYVPSVKTFTTLFCKSTQLVPPATSGLMFSAYSQRTPTKHLGTLRLAPQFFEGFNFTREGRGQAWVPRFHESPFGHHRPSEHPNP